MKWSVKLTGIFVTIALMLSIILIAAFPGNTANDGLTPPGGSINSGPVNISVNNGGTTADKIKASIILYVGSPVAYVNGIEKRIDTENIEVTPAIIDSREMVPVRFIAESLGGTVQWDRRSLTASIMLNNKSYQFTQNSETMVTGQKKIPLGAKVQAYNGRIFVPLDPFVEILGMKAFYDSRGLIVISDKENAFDSVKDKDLISEWISKLSFLPVVGSHENLISLLEEGQKNGSYRSGRFIKGMAIDQDVMLDGAMNGATMNKAEAAQSTAAGSDLTAAKAKSSVAEADAAGTGDYSATNVQVQGVDEGDIVTRNGEVCGRHNGIARYTIGQRRGVGIPEGMRVIGIDAVNNHIIVGTNELLYHHNLHIAECNIVDEEVLLSSNDITIKIRGIGRNPQLAVSVERSASGYIVKTQDPAWAPALGQPLVFYRNNWVIGGGIVVGFN